MQGQKLSEYVLWRNGLTPAEGQTWDDFLRSLGPEKNLQQEIDAFRFPGDAQASEKNPSPPSLSDTPRRLLVPPGSLAKD